MKHRIILNGIEAYSNAYIARSEDLNNTSNCVFTDWCVQTYFTIKDNKPYAKFVVSTESFSGKKLFETDDYMELEKWINEHEEELQSQIDTNADTWIEKYLNKK